MIQLQTLLAKNQRKTFSDLFPKMGRSFSESLRWRVIFLSRSGFSTNEIVDRVWISTIAQIIHVKMADHVQIRSTTILANVCLDTPDAIVQLI
ncbi:hypothetical protein AC249_AIPGENE21167 [Exaiptasia diaphana]|nr:hypothetical protein AC249_AIPGENE21167 [Exaiptasia diaphana]